VHRSVVSIAFGRFAHGEADLGIMLIPGGGGELSSVRFRYGPGNVCHISVQAAICPQSSSLQICVRCRQFSDEGSGSIG
jgi:hypothetical protein